MQTKQTYRRRQQFDELNSGSVFHDASSLQSGSGSNVGQGPSGLKLHLPIIVSIWSVGAQEFNELRDNSSLDQSVNGWITFPRKDLSGGLSGFESGVEVGRVNILLDFFNAHHGNFVGRILQRTCGLVIVHANVSPFRKQIIFLGFSQIHGDFVASTAKFLKNYEFFINEFYV